ncbi:hypothetical protein E3N86_09670 [Cryobacterium sp. Hz7]|uniref:Uncharacterized protein n=1 Tax=Cryobacterium sandaracinum TaxID=1259247 RepID=A0ABY2J897_9MICO|nr:hypothetical protein E3N86_09670 [Cryobacterium sp. Hz7]TFD00051.1 hypothetical protein E3T25_13375 [Cryobacterium sandaracinum]
MPVQVHGWPRRRRRPRPRPAPRPPPPRLHLHWPQRRPTCPPRPRPPRPRPPSLLPPNLHQPGLGPVSTPVRVLLLPQLRGPRRVRPICSVRHPRAPRRVRTPRRAWPLRSQRTAGVPQWTRRRPAPLPMPRGWPRPVARPEAAAPAGPGF